MIPETTHLCISSNDFENTIYFCSISSSSQNFKARRGDEKPHIVRSANEIIWKLGHIV